MSEEQTTEAVQEGQEAPKATPGSDEGTKPQTKDEKPREGESGKKDEEPDSFPREYVERLREESAKYRQKAGDRDALAQRLHAALVRETGRLADPDDLPFSDDHLTDAEALTTALDELLARKPHLAARRVYGDIGQGLREANNVPSLAGLLRANAR